MNKKRKVKLQKRNLSADFRNEQVAEGSNNLPVISTLLTQMETEQKPMPMPIADC